MKKKTNQLIAIGRLCLAPMVTVGVLLVVFALYGLFPFGTKTLSWGDMTQQVVPLLMQFRNILTGDESILYSFQAGGGMNFWGVFLFFLSSPFSFLVLLFPKTELILWINLIVVLKMMFCAFCAQLCFRLVFPRLKTTLQVILAVSYAFCGYVMLYYQNLVWLDMAALFPLLMLTVYQMLKKGRILPYILVLTAMLAVNFYLSYMVFLTLILLFFLLLCRYLPRERRGEVALKAGIGSVFSLLLASPIWIPFLFQYSHSARGGNLFESLTQCRFFCDIRTTLAVVLPSSIIFVAVLVVSRSYRLIQPAFKWLFVLLLIPMVIEPINRIWHTGSYQAFPARYGYLTVFIGLMLTAMALSFYQKDPVRNNRLGIVTVVVHLVANCGVMIGFLLFGRKNLSHYVSTLWVNDAQFSYLLLLFLLGVVGISVLLFFYANRQLTRKVMTVSLGVILIGGSFFQSVVYQGFAARDTESWLTAADLSDRIEEDSFYRVKNQEKYFDVNLVGAMGYVTLNHYTSLTPQDYLFGMKKLGYSSYWMEVNSTGGTALSDALLCNRYLIEKDDGLLESSDTVYRNKNYSILEQRYLPLGVIASDELSEELSDQTRRDVQNQLFCEIFSSREELMTEYQPQWVYNLTLEQQSGIYQIKRSDFQEAGGISYQVQVNGKQTLYFDCFDQLSTRLTEAVNGSFSVSVNGFNIKDQYPDKKQNGLLCLGTYENETVTIHLTVWKDVEAKSFGLYGLREDLLDRELQTASSADLTAKGRSISGNCFAQEGEVLFLAVPYDEGWKASVNEEAVTIRRVWDSFMEIPLENGENKIELTYLPQGWNAGIVGFCIGLVLLLLFLRFQDKVLKQPVLQKAAGWMLFGIGCAVLVIVYLMPAVLWIWAHTVM